MNEMPIERLRQVFHYEPDTGRLSWKLKPSPVANRVLIGMEAGSIKTDSHATYRRIRLDGKGWYAHRLTWALYYGYWPKGEVDHIDGNGLNNAIVNLRECTSAENAANRRVRTNNSSGTSGVSWHKRIGKWQAKIGKTGDSHHIGYFDRKEDAIAARREAEIEFHGKYAASQGILAGAVFS